MKKTSIKLLLLAFATFIISCGGSSSSKSSKSEESNDTDSPTATVEALIEAAQDGDYDGVKDCFSKHSAKEFDETFGEEDMDELADLTEGAKVLDEEINDDEAEVKVKFKKRKETIRLVKEDDKWLINDF